MRKFLRAMAQGKQTKGFLYYNNNYHVWIATTTEIITKGVELIHTF